MKILKWPKKLKDKWRSQYRESPKMPVDCIGFGFRNNGIDKNGPPIFGWQKHDDIFVEMGNAVNAMIAVLKDGKGYIINEDCDPVIIGYEQAIAWYLLCVNELRHKLCAKCTADLTIIRNKMNLGEALKNE